MNTRMLVRVGLGAGVVLGIGVLGCAQPQREVGMQPADHTAAPRTVVASEYAAREQAQPAPQPYSPQPVMAPSEPPLTRVEIPNRRVGENEFWVGGHWRWQGNDFVWEPGRIESRRTGQLFVPARWAETERGWEYIPERWR